MPRSLALLFILSLTLSCCTSSTPGAEAAPPAKGSGVWQSLTPDEAAVVEGCGTEPRFSGKFVHHKDEGTYTCTRCGTPLFSSESKFESGSGWPTFDDSVSNSVRELTDADGRRVEIRCARCDGHLGHVFRGERMTGKNTRHCVNSLSMDFVSHALEEAYFAGGCFWGVEALLENLPGVEEVVSGYMGGRVSNPSYKDVVRGTTGHAETVRVLFDPNKTSYETLTRMFFEIHDPTQVDRQGPDRGTQYRSAIFFSDDTQRKIATDLKGVLAKKGYKVATVIEKAGAFWPAEEYHQDYYARSGKAPYCHARVKRF